MDLMAIGDRYIGAVVQTDQGVFALDPRDQAVSRSLIELGHWGQEELRLARRFLRPNSRVLVVGAHIGALAVPMSQLVERLIAVEANPNMFRLLELNVAINQCHNLLTLNQAASDEAC